MRLQFCNWCFLDEDFTEELAHFVAVTRPLPDGLRWLLLPLLSPSSWGITAIKTFKNHAGLPGVFDICLFVSSLAPHHSTSPSDPLPQAPKGWIRGNVQFSGVAAGRCGRAMEQPEHLLPALCTKASLPKRINCPHPRTAHICPVAVVPLRHLVCPNTWGLTQSQGRGGRSLLEAQETFCHSLFAAFLAHWEAQEDSWIVMGCP